MPMLQELTYRLNDRGYPVQYGRDLDYGESQVLEGQ
jgi:hypothetical protein